MQKKKESKIRVDDDTPLVRETSGLRVSGQSTPSPPPQRLAEWERVSIDMALARDEEKEKKKGKKKKKEKKSFNSPSLPKQLPSPARLSIPTPLPSPQALFPTTGSSAPAASAAASRSSPSPSSLSASSVSDPQGVTRSTGLQFPALRQALQTHYRQASHLNLPLSERRFPIQDVSLTISDKSEQDRAREAKAKEPEKSDEKEKKSEGNSEFWSSQFRLEEA